MKKNVFFSFILTCLVAIAAHSQVNFVKGDIEDIKKYAAMQGKFIFIDVYATWCMPCKQMAREAFYDKEVSELMNAFFVNVQVDIEKEGRSIADKYKVEALPTTLIIDTTGATIAQNVGYDGVKLFIKFMENAAELTPDGRVFFIGKKAYSDHKKDFNYQLMYATLRKKLRMSNEIVTNEVIKNMPLDSLQQIHYQQFINSYAEEPDGKTFDFILKNRTFTLFENKLKLLVQKNFDLAVINKDKNLLKRVLKANSKIINDPSVSEEKNKALTLKFNEKTSVIKSEPSASTESSN